MFRSNAFKVFKVFKVSNCTNVSKFSKFTELSKFTEFSTFPEFSKFQVTLARLAGSRTSPPQDVSASSGLACSVGAGAPRRVQQSLPIRRGISNNLKDSDFSFFPGGISLVKYLFGNDRI